MSILNSKFLPFAALGKTYFEPIIDWRNALVQKLAEEVHLIKTQYLQAHANPAQASMEWWKQEYILWFGFGQVAKHQIRGMYETHAEFCRLSPLQIAKTLPATFVDYFLHLCDRSPRKRELHARIQDEISERSQGIPQPERTVAALIRLFGDEVIASAVKDIFLPSGRRILNHALLLLPRMNSLYDVFNWKTFNEKYRRQWIVYVASCADYFNHDIDQPDFLPRLEVVCKWLSSHKIPRSTHAKHLQEYLESTSELNDLIWNPYIPEETNYDFAKQHHPQLLRQHSFAHLSIRQRRNYGFE
ncbi:hypothetical protein JCM5350_001972 [Sporobolomyces pararoseus]